MYTSEAAQILLDRLKLDNTITKAIVSSPYLSKETKNQINEGLKTTKAIKDLLESLADCNICSSIGGGIGGTNSNVLIDCGSYLAPNENILIDCGSYL